MQSSSLEQPKHYNPADLRWPGCQQINHQTYLELLKNDLLGYKHDKLLLSKEKFNIF